MSIPREKGDSYQVPPPPPVFGRGVEDDDGVAAPLAASTLWQKLVYQLWMLLKSAGFVAHAASQTPAVPVLNGARRASPQKQLSYVSGSAVVTAGGTQAPLTSYKGPHCEAQAGNVARGKSVVSATEGQHPVLRGGIVYEVDRCCRLQCGTRTHLAGGSRLRNCPEVQLQAIVYRRV
jgi:hypothetical protein